MDFSALTAYLDSLKDVGMPGCDLAVYRDHRKIYRHYAGFRNREAGVPMDGNEVFRLYSATKLHTCTAALQLIERGKMGLDDPVSDYLPAFGTLSVLENGRIHAAYTVLTIRHLFAMQGGFNYDLHSPSLEKAIFYSRGKADTVTMVNALAEEPLSFNPGEHFQYCLCHDVLGAVVEVVSGMRFGEYLKTHIWDPLGMKDTGFRLTDEMRPRLAKLYMYDAAQQKTVPHPDPEKNPYQLTENYESGGAGLYSTVDDYILLTDALACGGTGKSGAHILKPATIDLMRKNQQEGQCLKDFQALKRFGYGYGLGVRTMMDPTYSKGPAGEFGWDGAACAYTLSDPKNRLSAFLGTHVCNFAYGYATVHPTIRDLIYEGLEK